jgi:hypothetical protein
MYAMRPSIELLDAACLVAAALLMAAAGSFSAVQSAVDHSQEFNRSMAP